MTFGPHSHSSGADWSFPAPANTIAHALRCMYGQQSKLIHACACSACMWVCSGRGPATTAVSGLRPERPLMVFPIGKLFDYASIRVGRVASLRWATPRPCGEGADTPMPEIVGRVEQRSQRWFHLGFVVCKKLVCYFCVCVFVRGFLLRNVRGNRRQL